MQNMPWPELSEKVAPGYKGFVFHADPEVTLEQRFKRDVI